MKHLFLTLFALLVLSVGAQAQRTQEVVYLKNGSVLRGTITEQTPGEQMKLRLRDGSILILKTDDVERISYEKLPRAGFSGRGERPRFSGSIELGGTLATTELHRIDILTSLGVQINPYLYAGTGVGLSGYALEDGLSVFTAYAHLRGRLPLGGLLSSFVEVRPGYGAAISDYFQGGFYLSALAGIEVGHFTFGVGLSLQRLKYVEPFGRRQDTSFVLGVPVTSVGPSVRLGFLF